MTKSIHKPNWLQTVAVFLTTLVLASAVNILTAYQISKAQSPAAAFTNPATLSSVILGEFDSILISLVVAIVERVYQRGKLLIGSFDEMKDQIDALMRLYPLTSAVLKLLLKARLNPTFLFALLGFSLTEENMCKISKTSRRRYLTILEPHLANCKKYYTIQRKPPASFLDPDGVGTKFLEMVGQIEGEKVRFFILDPKEITPDQEAWKESWKRYWAYTENGVQKSKSKRKVITYLISTDQLIDAARKEHYNLSETVLEDVILMDEYLLKYSDDRQELVYDVVDENERRNTLIRKVIELQSAEKKHPPKKLCFEEMKP